MRPIDLTQTYVHLEPGPGVHVLDVDERFWQTIGDRTELQTGRLVMAGDTTADWDHWEMHPHGDELIMVVRGAVRIHLDAPDDPTPTEPIELAAPQLVSMPAGTWHTMDVIEPARVVTITWGAGTQHRPR